MAESPRPGQRGGPVHADPVRGHVTCGELVFADVGPHLTVWSYSGDALEPSRARDLGEALVAWANRKEQTQ